MFVALETPSSACALDPSTEQIPQPPRATTVVYGGAGMQPGVTCVPTSTPSPTHTRMQTCLVQQQNSCSWRTSNSFGNDRKGFSRRKLTAPNSSRLAGYCATAPSRRWCTWVTGWVPRPQKEQVARMGVGVIHKGAHSLPCVLRRTWAKRSGASTEERRGMGVLADTNEVTHTMPSDRGLKPHGLRSHSCSKESPLLSAHNGYTKIEGV
jgi:hypothetical protein